VKIQRPKSLPPELLRKIRAKDVERLTLKEMIQYHLYAGRSYREIAEILTRNVSFKKLREEWERVGPLLGLSFEEYREIWRGHKRRKKGD